MTSDITTRLVNMCKDASMIQSKAGYKLGDRVIVLMDNDLDVIIAPNMHVKMSDNATSIPFGAIPKKFVVWIPTIGYCQELTRLHTKPFIRALHDFSETTYGEMFDTIDEIVFAMMMMHRYSEYWLGNKWVMI